MSVFGKIRGAKKAADAQKAQTQEQETTSKPVKQAYKHVPTHAAIDALAGTPTGHDKAERAAIKAAHLYRRDAVSRQNSSLSMANTMQRTGSYQSSTNQQNQRRHRPQFQSMQSLVVPENNTNMFSISSSQDPSPGHSPEGSTSSRDSSYIEMPYRHQVKSFEETIGRNQLPKNGTRRLGQAPKFSTAPERSAPEYGKINPAVVADKSKSSRRKSWMPFGQNRAPAVAAA